MTISRRSCLAVGVASMVPHQLVNAQANFPTRPVRWVVPFSAGGPADLLARLITQKLSEKWGQPVTVDNKPGGYTTIGVQDVLRMPPDGYTLLQPMDATMVMNQFMFSKLPYDVDKDFTHLSLLASLPLFLMAGERSEVRTFAEFVKVAKAKPGAVACGSPTTATQVALAQMSEALGIQVTTVPYKGTADALKGMLSGEIQFSLDAVPPYLGYVQSRKVTALASTGSKRSPSLPNVPTMIELGTNVEVIVWHGLSAPSGLPESIRAKLVGDVREALAKPDVAAKLLDVGLEVVASSPEDYVKLIRRDSSKLAPVIQKLGLKVN